MSSMLQIVGAALMAAAVLLVVVLNRLSRSNPGHILYRTVGTTVGAVVPLVGLAFGLGLILWGSGGDS
ncbi:MAG TPA: hypothetical protein VEH84_14350 [Alphaproteobacteria bacterium]|nr:hypothetical protein [Alphaproteobacteria bacterium]